MTIQLSLACRENIDFMKSKYGLDVDVRKTDGGYFITVRRGNELLFERFAVKAALGVAAAYQHWRREYVNAG